MAKNCFQLGVDSLNAHHLRAFFTSNKTTHITPLVIIPLGIKYCPLHLLTITDTAHANCGSSTSQQTTQQKEKHQKTTKRKNTHRSCFDSAQEVDCARETWGRRGGGGGH